MPVEAFVAGWLTPRTLRIRRSRAQASPRRVVSLGKKLYSTLSFFTQVYKWVPATSDSTLRFYNSCVNNYFIYCSAAWGNCSHHLLLRLLRLQKRAGRILLDADLSQASISLFLKLNWIPVFDLIKYRKLFFFSSYSLIRMLLNVSGTDFNFFVIRVDLWAVLQEPLSTT